MLIESHCKFLHPIEASAQVVREIGALLATPNADIDYARSKVVLDALVDPSVDVERTFAGLDQLTEAACLLAGPQPSELSRLRAVRTTIYRAGPWNDNRPFDYDHDGFKDLRVKLLSHYLESRRGNCVSMPILFLNRSIRIV